MRGTLLLLLLATGLGMANPNVHLSPAERARLKEIVTQRGSGWNPFPLELSRSPENGPLFLALAEESQDPMEICAAIDACNSLYALNPLKADGRRLIDRNFKAVTRHLLRHPDGKVRERAVSSMADKCIFGLQPDVSFFPLIKSAYQREPDGHARSLMLSAFRFCMAPDPTVAELLLKGLRDEHSEVLRSAVGLVAFRYWKGTEYGSAFRAQARPLIEHLYRRDEADLRAEAMHCTVMMTPVTSRRTYLDALFTRFLKDPDGGVVAATLRDIGDSKATRLILPVCLLLGDPRSADLREQSRGGSIEEYGPLEHFVLECLHELSEDLLGSDGFRYTYHRQTAPKESLAREVARARAWLQEHREVLSRPAPHRS